MSLFERPRFEAFVLGLAHTEIVHQWGDASVGKVGPSGSGKIFAILSSWSSERPAISFKCTQISYEMLCEIEGVRPAPYLARAGWVQVGDNAPLDDDDLGAYIGHAHGIVLAKFPLKVRTALGAGT